METNRRKQIIGSQAELKNGPADMRNESFRSGTIQMVGSQAELAQATVPQGEFNKGIREGRYDIIGSQAEFTSREPRRGWQSYETPISRNSEEAQKPVSGYPPKR